MKIIVQSSIFGVQNANFPGCRYHLASNKKVQKMACECADPGPNHPLGHG